MDKISKLAIFAVSIACVIKDDYGNCACKVCSPYLHKLYLEKNEILRNSEIICINKKTRKNVNFDEKMNTVSKILLAALMFVVLIFHVYIVKLKIWLRPP
jgi:hypothetical protein